MHHRVNGFQQVVVGYLKQDIVVHHDLIITGPDIAAPVASGKNAPAGTVRPDGFVRRVAVDRLGYPLPVGGQGIGKPFYRVDEPVVSVGDRVLTAFICSKLGGKILRLGQKTGTALFTEGCDLLALLLLFAVIVLAV